MLVDLNSSLKNGHLLSYLKQDSINWSIYHNEQYKWLLMNHTVQSIMDTRLPGLLTLPHQQPLKGLVDELPAQADVLELGLGGGSNARYIKQQRPDSHITIVEQSPIVIRWFERYFNPQSVRLNLIEQNAETFILNETTQYDLVITDLFRSETSILSCLNAEFFIHLNKLIKPGGMAYLNFLAETDKEPEIIKNYLHSTGLKIHWGEKIIGFKNWVFLLSKSFKK